MPDQFPETQWSQLLELRDPSSPRRREILEGLALAYWRPVYHYVRALRRVSTDDAEDLTQQFFTTLLHRGDLDRLSPDRGSFRGFLKTALKHFLASADRAARARPALFPFAEAEASFAEHAGVGPDEAFDREWARGLLVEAVERLRGELRDEGRETQLAVFEAYCLRDEEVTYAALADRLGVREDDVRNRLRESRQRLRDLVRRRVRAYLGPGQDVEDELAFILGR